MAGPQNVMTDSTKAKVEARRQTRLRFQQAKKPTPGSQFLQIVAKPKRSARKKARAEADASGLQGLATDGVLQRARASEPDRALAL